jgi:hypothetical protein
LAYKGLNLKTEAMKARIFTTAVLMIVALATTYAQTSRRSERRSEQSTQTQERKSNEVKSDNKNVNERSSRRAVTPAENQQDNNRRGNQPQAEQSRRENNNTPATRTVETNRPENNRVNNNTPDNRRGERRGNDNSRTVQRSDNDNHYGEIHHSTRGNREYIHIEHNPRRVVVVNHPRHYSPRPVEYRRVHNPYRVPLHHEVFWSINLHNDFRIFYPEVRYWRYETGYRLPSIPAYDAIDYVGEVVRIYGRVFEVHYEYDTDDYFLYFGDYYPYQDFTIIISGEEARRFSRRPERVFQRADIAVTGYVTEFENRPEVVVRRASQIDMY